MADAKYSSQEALTDQLIQEASAKTRSLSPNEQMKNLKTSFILNLGRKSGYASITSRSNEDLKGQCLKFDASSMTESKNECSGDNSHQNSNHTTPDRSPTSEIWFKTWPERYEKVKSTESSPEHKQNTSIKNTQNQSCDIYKFEINSFKTKLTLNEALKNISLAYSPVTKQLHLINKDDRNSEEESQNESLIANGEQEKLDDEKNSSMSEKDNILTSESSDTRKSFTLEDNVIFSAKKGHRRNQAGGSFSSTISSLSEPSTSGSLLEGEERSLTSLEDCEDGKSKRRGLTNFFSKNVFSWKSNSSTEIGANIWKIFGRNTQELTGSPIHKVASSSALIPHKRPSTLPAKTQEEEIRHMTEYNAILAAAKKKEAKDSIAKQKQQKMQLQLEEQQAAATKHFLQNVIPKWDQMEKSKKTQELWWQGLPSSVRGKVWTLAIGNELNITPQLYDICLERARKRLNNPDFIDQEVTDSVNLESSMDAIELDISRTFPHLGIFQQGGPYWDVLQSLLAAYVCFRPDVGYVQGMSYIAAILILNMDPCEAFICFANLLNQPLHLSAFTLNQHQMQSYYDAYNEIFSLNLPKLHSHFEVAGLTPDLYLLDWIYTIFAKAMPLDVACRVWDLFFRDGYEFVFRTALGILNLYQSTLLTMDFLHGAQFLTKLPEDVSSDQLFKSIHSVTTNVGKLTFGQVVEKCSLKSCNMYR